MPKNRNLRNPLYLKTVYPRKKYFKFKNAKFPKGTTIVKTTAVRLGSFTWDAETKKIRVHKGEKSANLNRLRARIAGA